LELSKKIVFLHIVFIIIFYIGIQMKYKNFDVTPVGNATLQIQENKLVVSNIGDSGVDGVQINSNDIGNYKIFFLSFQIYQI